MNEDETKEIPVEDLTISPEQGNEVKGGRGTDFYLKLQTLDGDVTYSTTAPSISEIVVSKNMDIK